MKNEYLVIIHDDSEYYLSEPLVYSAVGDSYQSVEKDVRSRLDEYEIESCKILIMLKQDLISLTELPVINKEKKGEKIKTAIIFDECTADITFFIVDEDWTRFDNVYVNGCEEDNEAICDEFYEKFFLIIINVGFQWSQRMSLDKLL